MDGVGPGTVLGGRYSTDRRIERRLGTERWTAHDATLGRNVEVVCLPSDDPRSAPLLDAARRAAALDSPRLVRILDVGHDEQVSFVVEEDLSDTHSLTALVQEGGLPADEVRRITGELATALDAASQRGLHHLALTPADVLRDPEGEVKVRGIATTSVCAGVDDLESEPASRQDAVGVVSVMYAGLTGLWPGTGDSGGLGRAPRVPSGVAAPSELASGVPRDLDALCRLTLNDDQGPLSPGDYARQVAPWSSVPVALSRPVPAAAATETPSESTPVRPAAEGRAPRSRQAATQSEPTVVLPVQAPAAAAGGAGAEGLLGGAGAAVAGAGSAVADAGAAVAGAMGRAGERVGSTARRLGQRAASIGSGEDEESPAPLIPSEPLDRSESRVALGIVAAFVVLALFIGIWGVSRIGSQSSLGLGSGATTGSTSTGSAVPSGSASPTGTATGSATGSAAAPMEDLAVLSADGFDPLGDHTENNSMAGRVYDGNTSTEWTSERYNTADLGGLKKGVGVIVDIGPNVSAREVDLIMPVAADVTVYLADQRALDGATSLGSQSNARGKVVFPVKAGVTGQYIIVWFTRLTQDDKGEYRAHLAEVIPRG